MIDFSVIAKWYEQNVGLVSTEQVFGWLTYQQNNPLLFNSALFLGMFLLFYLIYILTANTHRFRIMYVVAFSLFFYYKSSGIFFLLLIFSSVVDYFLANQIHKEERQGVRKFYMGTSLVINLGLLAYFKYTYFIVDNVNILFGKNFSVGDIILPVGISFYTFQTLSYTIDVYRRQLDPAKSFMDFLFFVSFFPQLVAGPIVRASDFIPQMYTKPKLTKLEISAAFSLIITGLLKKAVISDYISTNFVDRVFDSPNLYSAFENLMAAYGYAIQIYCDFSGYSDMAIGLAILMGFLLPPNFDSPYKSRSVTEFWRRWHISLSSWLRDYLYITLGGNRKGKIRTYINLFLTMVLGGLWHGASWKFVFWGVMHGGALAFERYTKNFIALPKNFLVRIIQVALTFHFVVFCWLFFRAKDFATAFDIVQNIGAITFEPTQWWAIVQGYSGVFILLAIGFLWHFTPTAVNRAVRSVFNRIPLVIKAILLAFTYWIVYATASAGPQPFIYFQF